MKVSRIALLSAATLVVAQPHHHAHRHAARHGSPIEVRAPQVVEYVPGPTVTVYNLNGQPISAAEVEAGILSGKYVIVGGAISSVVQAPPVIPSTSTPYLNLLPSSFPTTSPGTPIPTYAAPTTPSTPVAAKSSSTPAAAYSSSSGSGNINADFPSGTIPCSTFPSAYGAIFIDWLGLNGWTGVQNVPNFSPGDSLISYIETAVSGSGCTANSYCSYACPAGYQKSQWPTAQGSSHQSIGGLYCNSNGMLELSRTSVSQICTAGVGNVKVQNKLSDNVAVCRTDYPGLESETIPLNTQPGQTYPLTCPDAAVYYSWENLPTSAQYYINPRGTSETIACQWGSPGTNIGNWAPVNAGVGKSIEGTTFISLLPNIPTNPDGTLDFCITITGDISGSCSYSDGTYYQDGVISSTGCTVAVTGTATFVFS